MNCSHIRAGVFDDANPLAASFPHGLDGRRGDGVLLVPPHVDGEPRHRVTASGELEFAIVGSTPLTSAVARGVNLRSRQRVHVKGASQGLAVKNGIDAAVTLRCITTTAHYIVLVAKNLVRYHGGVRRSARTKVRRRWLLGEYAHASDKLTAAPTRRDPDTSSWTMLGVTTQQLGDDAERSSRRIDLVGYFETAKDDERRRLRIFKQAGCVPAFEPGGPRMRWSVYQVRTRRRRTTP